ncbi:MAG: alcohol dehydrogenase catalytic domain-containing protein [Candidatus Marinimicrobia bacterium]|nr:alcohol dehydrogenase catalytic domain-containing protein [Candidatus Neomarinimicrobiota bacterium]MBT3630094.1 alcohol dehydrogenase catalytic domain-containing protein [Candidatus Neomarinimicrobiota bacterium]MBT3824261.1 alcohol dehydrogenase catalytic domain-containing protein [Candidatus Neomarinimicrobiota bacterium]MBT4131713.1 alcohol dehydrogenase catalytic domain-containing protein [Candidatus Neomarinimicrobiota bacterium]MBT4295457.1 alcohol dehydrogenase catalytic domain-conta
MKTLSLFAEWDPKPDFKLGSKDIEGKLTYLGSKVWRNPYVDFVEKDIPEPNDTQVLIEIKACGICGSDVHMLQTDEDGYIFYPGLTAFPATLGHEYSGVVAKAGPNAINKTTGLPFQVGEAVCAEEMIWCGSCRPCADGYPNHCESLQEIGFSIDGAYTNYIAVDARYIWSIEALRPIYGEQKMFDLGSLVEPTSVAYNAVIERGGGIRPGDSVLVMGSGPVGIAACAVLKHAGAAHVIISEPSKSRRELALKTGATHGIDPDKENVADRVLEITNGMGANLILEATGLPSVVWQDIEKVIWEGKALNATVVIVARADDKIPMNGEVFQVRRAQVVGAQGHSGHGTFPRVIASMAGGMDVSGLITKRISLEEIPENLKMLQTDRNEVKITMFPK